MVKKIVVLGASGMLGHKMLQILSKRFEVTGTLRKNNKSYILDPYLLTYGANAEDFLSISKILNLLDPDVIINCIGIVKQLPESNDWNKSHIVNSEFPHKLSIYSKTYDIRLIHISTDCVFDGKSGMYKEDEIPDAVDIYGRTKFTGETPECLTLRTSIIGREIDTRHGLLEWFLFKKGMKIQGYKKSIFSGVTTNELSHLGDDIIYNGKGLRGLYHVASIPINKFDLLSLVNSYLDEKDKVEIEPVDGENINRSLDGSKLKHDFGYVAPDWDTMIAEVMKRDKTVYGDKL